MFPFTFSSILHCADSHIAGLGRLSSKLFFAEEFEESPLASVVTAIGRLFSVNEREAESPVGFMAESVSDEMPTLVLSACVDLVLSLQVRFPLSWCSIRYDRHFIVKFHFFCSLCTVCL